MIEDPHNYIMSLPPDVRGVINKFTFPFPKCGTMCSCPSCYLDAPFQLVTDMNKMLSFTVKVQYEFIRSNTVTLTIHCGGMNRRRHFNYDLEFSRFPLVISNFNMSSFCQFIDSIVQPGRYIHHDLMVELTPTQIWIYHYEEERCTLVLIVPIQCLCYIKEIRDQGKNVLSGGTGKRYSSFLIDDFGLDALDRLKDALVHLQSR